jgi:Amino acid synthesis
MPPGLRKVVTFCEEIRSEGGRSDGTPLRKAAAAAVVANPYAGRPFSDNLDEIVESSAALGSLLGDRLASLLDAPVESYGKAALVGLNGEQEHAVAIKTSTMGDAFRSAIGGGTAWLPSTSKRCPPGTLVDVPLCCTEDVWVRSHYDSIAVCIPDAPLPDEIVLIVAVASRGRLNARLGGKTRQGTVKGAT